MANKQYVEGLKRQHSHRLLRLDGVSGVGVERDGPDEDSYVLVVHLADDDPSARAAAVKGIEGEPIRVVTSGRFRKQ